ncbi:M48 family metalloprotease [Streptomyces sp. NPDC056061]|uniref:M48 family metalloprotease n=1 Tax=Streptomyces sp. NPDC056061 TaxID=3345700 RepID=UPI0035D629EE
MSPTSRPQNPGDGHVPSPGRDPDPDPSTTAPPDDSVPDDLVYEHGPGRRVYYAARQWRMDLTAVGQLALALPAFLTSALVVLLAGVLLEIGPGVPYWIPVALWVVSGALVFHPPAEDLLARYLFGLRRPMPREAARLEPVWREVTAVAGVDGTRYRLWVEESDGLNALAAAGHIVGVTQYALEQLSTRRLAAVLAHELGHHSGGHAWSLLLCHWYGLPGRLVRRALRAMAASLVTPARCVVYLAGGVLLLALGGLDSTATRILYGIPLLLALPYLSAAVGRRTELRADRHAAVLGFAPDLAEVLEMLHADELPAHTSVPARLLSTHPDIPTRLHHLRRYL